MLIPLAEYARRLGKSHQTVRQKVLRGHLQAEKIGTTWMIEESEPYVDGRYNSGPDENPRNLEEKEG